jgi:hypothetical protein
MTEKRPGRNLRPGRFFNRICPRACAWDRRVLCSQHPILIKYLAQGCPIA